MNEKALMRIQLECLYEMFRDRIEENVVYIVYSENNGKIDVTIDQLMSIASCAFTGHHFEQKCLQDKTLTSANYSSHKPNGSVGTCTASNNSNHRSAAKFFDSCNSNSLAIPNVTTGEKKNLDEESIADEEQEEDNFTGLTIDERIERLQKSIDDLLMEKKTSHDKASQYLSKKMFSVTSYYSELAGQIRRMIEKKTKQLVELLLEKSQNSNNIDLHGLNPVQARLVVSELLNIRQDKLLIDKQGEASIDIITGWGKHCVTNGHRIRPTIVALLREKGFEYQFLNKGALRVVIRR